MFRRVGAGAVITGAWGRRGNLGHPGQDFDIRRRMVKIIVRDDGAERLAAGHAELILVKFLEERALVPGRAFEFLMVLPKSFWIC